MNLTKLDHKDVVVRAAKTAVQAFLASLVATNLSLTKSALLAAAAAAFSAVFNYALQVAQG